jgi:hypothetical protein
VDQWVLTGKGNVEVRCEVQEEESDDDGDVCFTPFD